MIASVGGGLCQLSNALYDAALKAGCDIVERHAHSRRIEGSMAAQGRDATIFWNYVDLRFRPPVDCQLQVALDRDELKVTLRRLGSPAKNLRTGFAQGLASRPRRRSARRELRDLRHGHLFPP